MKMFRYTIIKTKELKQLKKDKDKYLELYLTHLRENCVMAKAELKTAENLRILESKLILLNKMVEQLG